MHWCYQHLMTCGKKHSLSRSKDSQLCYGVRWGNKPNRGRPTEEHRSFSWFSISLCPACGEYQWKHFWKNTSNEKLEFCWEEKVPRIKISWTAFWFLSEKNKIRFSSLWDKVPCVLNFPGCEISNDMSKFPGVGQEWKLSLTALINLYLTHPVRAHTAISDLWECF